MDAPITLPRRATASVWSPENYSRDYYGPLTLRRGLELSRNVMTVRLAQGVGMKQDRRPRHRAGRGRRRWQPVLSMSLGAGETTPFKLTAAYAAFANGGRRIEPHLIEMVAGPRRQDHLPRRPRATARAASRAFSGEESPAPRRRAATQVIDPITAYQITSMLRGRGPARHRPPRPASLGRPVGGKTGTTNEYRSPGSSASRRDLVVGVFVGFDDNRSPGRRRDRRGRPPCRSSSTSCTRPCSGQPAEAVPAARRTPSSPWSTASARPSGPAPSPGSVAGRRRRAAQPARGPRALQRGLARRPPSRRADSAARRGGAAAPPPPAART